jgi:SpoVK/Ycf46/Vps4 family AAA+-type ATPase
VSRGADRYANLEVAYLLQALESHDGVVVVTTNARDKIDRAFLRRFDVVLEFGRPDVARRERLWRRELGAAARSLTDAFLVEVAHKADLAGGHIAAAARLARALAAEAGRRDVQPEDVLEAVAFEHEKLGSSLAATRLREEAQIVQKVDGTRSRWRS